MNKRILFLIIIAFFFLMNLFPAFAQEEKLSGWEYDLVKGDVLFKTCEIKKGEKK